ncbi:MAG: cation transporter [Treponema sp.]|nr:cation transporter [Treponema sp.]
MEKMKIKIEGMSCNHCVAAVSKALTDLGGLEKIKVDLKSNTASFNYDPQKTLPEKIKAAVAEAGYTALI